MEYKDWDNNTKMIWEVFNAVLNLGIHIGESGKRRCIMDTINNNLCKNHDNRPKIFCSVCADNIKKTAQKEHHIISEQSSTNCPFCDYIFKAGQHQACLTTLDEKEKQIDELLKTTLEFYEKSKIRPHCELCSKIIPVEEWDICESCRKEKDKIKMQQESQEARAEVLEEIINNLNKYEYEDVPESVWEFIGIFIQELEAMKKRRI